MKSEDVTSLPAQLMKLHQEVVDVYRREVYDLKMRVLLLEGELAMAKADAQAERKDKNT